ncbi:MAG: hypothetical protein AAF685_07785 [Cyanobacteria bacterium P01_C01_bin.89]
MGILALPVGPHQGRSQKRISAPGLRFINHQTYKISAAVSAAIKGKPKDIIET